MNQRLSKQIAERDTAKRALAAMAPEEAALRTEIAGLSGYDWPPDDQLQRELWVTPFAGNYGPAGYVVVLNGSPPRFVAVVMAGGYANDPVTVLAPRRHPLVITQGMPAKWQGLRKALLAYIAWWMRRDAPEWAHSSLERRLAHD